MSLRTIERQVFQLMCVIHMTHNNVFEGFFFTAAKSICEANNAVIALILILTLKIPQSSPLAWTDIP